MVRMELRKVSKVGVNQGVTCAVCCVVDSITIEKYSKEYIILSIYITKRPFLNDGIKQKHTTHEKLMNYEVKPLNQYGNRTLHIVITESFHQGIIRAFKI